MSEKRAAIIYRKSLLYHSKVEYGSYTINHIEGCSHGCLYPCYAMLMAKRFGKIKGYEEWLQPKIVANAADLLIGELDSSKKSIDSVHLCFTTDPFMYGYSDISALSLRLIKIINEHSIPCSVLTKGILPRRLASLGKDNRYGITLISLDEPFRKNMEPHSAPLSKRISALRHLSEQGFKTWVSIEPYPTPNIINQSLSEILKAVSFVDRIVFGRMNYNRIVSKYVGYKAFFNTSAQEVIDFGKKEEIEIYIKKGTITEYA